MTPYRGYVKENESSAVLGHPCNDVVCSAWVGLPWDSSRGMSINNLENLISLDNCNFFYSPVDDSPVFYFPVDDSPGT